MQGGSSPAERQLAAIARLLGDLKDELVFVGGAVVGLFLTDPAAPEVSATKDVDAIVAVSDRWAYYRIEERLRAKGFRESPDEGVICRWRHGALILDVMPTEESILGFSNRWYAEAVSAAQIVIAAGVAIKVAPPDCFLATKLEALKGRGNRDYMASKDLEDIVAVLDGRPEMVREVESAAEEIKEYIACELKALLQDEYFIDALSGHVPGDAASQARVPVLMRRMEAIAGLCRGHGSG